MSETQRRKKDGTDKSTKNQRIDKMVNDPRQGEDRPDVDNDRTPPDSFDRDLKRDSDVRGRGNKHVKE